jgi:hypothetical protein
MTFNSPIIYKQFPCQYLAKALNGLKQAAAGSPKP